MAYRSKEGPKLKGFCVLLFFILNCVLSLSFDFVVSCIFFWALNLHTFAQENLSLFENTKCEFIMVNVPMCWVFLNIKTGCRIKKKNKTKDAPTESFVIPVF